MKRTANILIVSLMVLQLAVILGSWLWSAAMPSSDVRAILSDSGVRWFFGTFVSNISSPLLVWIILLGFAFTACRRSGLWSTLCMVGRHSRRKELTSRLSALMAALALVVIELAVFLLLTLPRHAILHSSIGTIYPSAASASLVPVIAFMILTASVGYGMFSGSLHNYRDAIHCCIAGGSILKLFLAIYVLAMQLYKMIVYVMGG